MFIQAKDSTVVYVNKAYSANFNVSAKKIIGRKLFDIEVNSRILSVLKDGIPLNVTAIMMDVLGIPFELAIAFVISD